MGKVYFPHAKEFSCLVFLNSLVSLRAGFTFPAAVWNIALKSSESYTLTMARAGVWYQASQTLGPLCHFTGCSVTSEGL